MSSKQDNTVKAVRVRPIIAPGMRGGRMFNTEMEKKSVYLGGKFFEKDKINGTCTYTFNILQSYSVEIIASFKLK